MSAHREPDLVAEYAKGARERGLRVIIAGAGISAALPGRGRRSHRAAGDRRAPVGPSDRRGRARRDPLDRADAPGVPVACVGLNNARNAAMLAAKILGA